MDRESIAEAEPAAVVAIILGASEFPKANALPASPAFAGSASAFTDYLKSEHGLRLADDQVLDLFDHDGNVIDQNDQLTEYLLRNQNASDLVIYYVGHGGFLPDREYFLALRSTKQGAEGLTGLRIQALAHLVEEYFPGKRVFLILDCCFAGEAVAQFQSDELGTIVENKTFDALPEAGTSLLVAASKDEPAIAPTGAAYTMFSDCFLEVLAEGIAGGRKALSLAEIGAVVQRRIRSKFGQRGVRPEVHSPRQGEGDIANIPLFPNPAYSPPKPKALPAGIHDALRNPLADIREGAIRPLARLMDSGDQEIARLARAELERLADQDDSRSVQERAADALGKQEVPKIPEPRPEEPRIQEPLAKERRPRRTGRAIAAGIAVIAVAVGAFWRMNAPDVDKGQPVSPAVEESVEASTPQKTTSVDTANDRKPPEKAVETADVPKPPEKAVETAKVPKPPAKPDEKTQRRQQVEVLLAAAERNFDQGHLDSPKGNNAVEGYRAVLALDTGNQAARTGLHRVLSRNLELAANALDGGALGKAENFLASAERIEPGNAEAVKIRTGIEKARTAAEDREGIRKLLADAQKDLQQDRLTTPRGNNAVERYRDVLHRDPGNQAARAGLARVVSRYITLANAAIAGQKFNKAKAYLAKAEGIDLTNAEARNSRARLEQAQATAQDREEIQRLLATADRNLQQDRLDSPKGNNAVEGYRAVLALESDNQAARTGLRGVVRRYLALSKASLADNEFDKAAKYLASAEGIEADNPELADVRAQLEEALATPSRLAFAVFPFQSLANCHYSVRDEVTDAADAAIRGQPVAELNYSYYAEGADASVIPGVYELWSDNAARREPMLETVRKAGGNLGVNGVLMVWYICSRSQYIPVDTYEVEAYLIDVKQDQVFHSKTNFLDAGRAISGVFDQFFAAYGVVRP